MKLDDLKKILLELLKKCSKFSFKEQVAFLMKEAEKHEETEVKVVIYLYIQYLIQQYNTKGTTPFVLPPLEEIRDLSQKVVDRRMELDDLVKDVEIQTSRVAGGIYTQSLEPVKGVSSDDAVYREEPLELKGYQDQYQPTDSGDIYRQTMGIKKVDFEGSEPSKLESLAEGTGIERKDYDRVDVRYEPRGKSIADKAKAERKKILMVDYETRA
jgi:hypothetical protein